MRMLATSLALLVILGAAVSAQKSTPSPYDDAEAYAVYSAVLVNEWPVREAKAKALVIQLETTGFMPFSEKDITTCLTPAKGEESIYTPVLDAYRDANKVPRTLLQKFTIGIPYGFLPTADFKALFAKNGISGAWQEFYKKYPDSGGINELSAIGFSADRTTAIVYAGHWCNDLCGGGRYHVLKKTEGKWAEIKWNGESCSWAS